ncbi:MAG TPA: zinc ribbon domain-containing protein [Pyrinomonadaceae bacterium]|nr:zinc ribbon domain-containing protein [Pyrinomonadaceae bacterium]
MFCPKCGQQQSSDGVRFCSRCGFRLEVVRELLVTDGVLVSPFAETQKSRRSPRNRGIRQGAMLMMLTVLIVPVSALLSKLGLLPKEFVALASIICVIGGFLRLVYAFMFEEGAQSMKRAFPAYASPATPAHLHAGTAPSALPPPPPQSRPAVSFSRPRSQTAEMMSPPPSVTENTTRLLDRADDDD